MKKIVLISILLSFIFIIACSDDTVDLKYKPRPEPPVTNRLEIDTLPKSTPMEHIGAKGGLHTDDDFARVKNAITSGNADVVAGFAKLQNSPFITNPPAPNPTTYIIRGTTSIGGENYGTAMNQVAAAYQLALMWRITDNATYADAAIAILNAWASTCIGIAGDTNASLASGIYGYQFAVAGELMRNYIGWAAADLAAYKQWILDVVYPGNIDFLTRHHGTCSTHYWANWDLCNLASMLAVGIFTDRRDIYNTAIVYLQKGEGNGNWELCMNYPHTVDGKEMYQMQETGRDQGHTLMCIGMLGTICQLTWNQGDDFYGYKDNRYLKASEYVARYNVAALEVPFHEYIRRWSHDCREEVHTVVGESGRGGARPIWSAAYYHYTKIKGIDSAKLQYTLMGVNSTKPEGGGGTGDYGSTSGGYDQLGFGTLMFTQ